MKPTIIQGNSTICDIEYTQWVSDLKNALLSAKASAVIRANAEKLFWNWQLGRDLVLRKAEERWGAGVVEQVSLDLQAEFPNEKGLSTDNLWAMKRWYLFYAQQPNPKLEQPVQELQTPNDEWITKLVQPVQVFDTTSQGMRFPLCFALVPWGQHLDIVRLSQSVEEALFYIQQTIKEGWSRSVLQRNLKNNLYAKQGAAISNFAIQLPMNQAKLAQQITKENYDFGFISLPTDYEELELEAALEKHISRFLLELGSGFAYIGRQKELIVDGVSRRIDMLFYHIKLRCYVVIELKACRFEPEFAGKLNFYVNAVDEILKTSADNPTIGLLICSDMRQTEVQYSFKGLSTPIGVSTYNNVLLREIERELPTVEQLQQKITQLQQMLKHKN